MTNIKCKILTYVEYLCSKTLIIHVIMYIFYKIISQSSTLYQNITNNVTRNLHSIAKIYQISEF